MSKKSCPVRRTCENLIRISTALPSGRTSSTGILGDICKNPVSHGNYYWNTSPEHRLIAMLAISALLEQMPLYLITDNNNKNFFTVGMVRLLTHISERKIQRIIKNGIIREDLILINNKYSQYQGTKQLLGLYKDCEKSWITAQALEIKSLNNNTT